MNAHVAISTHRCLKELIEPVRVLLAIWHAPDLKRVAKMVRTVYTPSGWHSDEDTYELVQYRVQQELPEASRFPRPVQALR